MKNFTKKLSAVVLSTVFATMQVSAAYTNFDTGLGSQNGGAVINNATPGLTDIQTGTGSATLNFNDNTVVNWNTLNVDKGETLNFDAVDGANNLTILNTVNYGMSTFAGTVNSNSGIGKLIISNPNGVLFDGTKFTTAGDLVVTTRDMTGVDINNLTDGTYTKLIDGSGNLIPVVIRNGSEFNIGGDYTIFAPQIDASSSTVNAKTFKLVTANGQDYIGLGIANKTPVNNHGVTFLEAMQINGDVVITNAVGAMDILNGGTINGNLTVNTAGNTYLNYDNTNGEKLVINGNADITSAGVQTFLRDVEVKNDLSVKSTGGFVEVGNTKVGGNANLKTEVFDPIHNDKYNHFIHIIGNTEVAGDLNIDSAQNIHIGGYYIEQTQPSYHGQLAEGSLKVGGDLNATARAGHITTTVNTTAKNVKFTANALNDGTRIYGGNILSDGKAVITADTYEFTAAGFIGSVKELANGTVDDQIIDRMENYTFAPVDVENPGYLNIAGGKITKLETPGNAYIASKGDLELTGANAGNINLTAYGKRIDITGPDVHANNINVGDETDYLKVEFPGRDYTLNYTNIRDGVVVTVNPDEVVTYELTDGPNGYNQTTLTPGAHTTYLIGPDPEVKPIPDPKINDNENAKNLMGRWTPEDETASPVSTPVAFAADLDDDELDTAVRKNVDGSVTVVRAFPMGK